MKTGVMIQSRRELIDDDRFAKQLPIDFEKGIFIDGKFEKRVIPTDGEFDRTIAVTSCWFERPLDDDWFIAYQLFVQAGIPVIGELRIFPREDFRRRPPGEWSASLLGVEAKVPAGGITAPLLRKVKFGTVKTKTAETLKEYRTAVPELMSHLGLQIKEIAPRPPKREKRGRPALSDRECARIADFYARRCVEESRSPVSDTAKHFRISMATARTRIATARIRGFLTHSQPGQGWGEITGKTRQVLKQKSVEGAQ